MQATARHRCRPQTRHLLVWVVGCAVGFAAYHSIAPPLALLAPRGRTFVAGYTPAMGMAFGTILTGCGVLVYRRWRGDTSYPSRAGHWLLLFGLAAAAADIAAVVAYNHRAVRDPYLSITPFLIQFNGRNAPWPSMYHQTVGWGLGTMISLGFLLAVRRRLERHWCAVFFVFFLAAAILAAGQINTLVQAHLGINPLSSIHTLTRVYAGCVLLGGITILRAVAGDRRSGTIGDGLHRLGVGAWLTITAIQMTMYGLFIMW
jgi:hypothetical protein